MSTELTVAAVGTPVVDATGLELGIVSAVEDGAAMLDPDPTITDEIRSLLGFATVGSDHIAVTGDLIQSTDEGVIRLSVTNRHL